MTYSYTQISQYLRCPRSYRYRYLDGWREKDSRLRCASAAASRRPWQPCSRERTPEPCCSRSGRCTARLNLEYWEGRQLGAGAAARDRTARTAGPRQPHSHPPTASNLQKKLLRSLPNGGEFVAYVDAIGYLDGTKRLLEWKTTTARYPEQPEGLTQPGPATGLLLLDQRHLGGSDCGFREEAGPGDSVSDGFDQRRATAGVWSTGRSDDQSD